MENVVQISRDPFARETLVRRVVKGYSCCQWCGNERVQGGLFEYGTERYDRPGVNWHKGYFCSKGCHDSYHS